MMTARVVTTSWDDGHKSDLRLAQMLSEHGLEATFYVSPENHEFAKRDLLTAQEVRDLSHDFEVGAHTLTHPRLPVIPEDRAREEIVESKVMLERITGGVVSSFCYPYGSYTDMHVKLVKDAGYKYARTVARYEFGLAKPYEAGTSVQAYSHRLDAWRIAYFARFRPIKILRYRDWDALARDMFDHVMHRGGIYHLWGHSWEIDEHGDWERLERVFRYISARPKVSYVANGELEAYRR
jgi:peptidoglycan/xylan/chitin deacetylase (PgdA/CDA1 family)